MYEKCDRRVSIPRIESGKLFPNISFLAIKAKEDAMRPQKQFASQYLRISSLQQ